MVPPAGWVAGCDVGTGCWVAGGADVGAVVPLPPVPVVGAVGGGVVSGPVGVVDGVGGLLPGTLGVGDIGCLPPEVAGGWLWLPLLLPLPPPLPLSVGCCGRLLFGVVGAWVRLPPWWARWPPARSTPRWTTGWSRRACRPRRRPSR